MDLILRLGTDTECHGKLGGEKKNSVRGFPISLGFLYERKCIFTIFNSGNYCSLEMGLNSTGQVSYKTRLCSVMFTLPVIMGKHGEGVLVSH